jgi:hypothetical protein
LSTGSDGKVRGEPFEEGPLAGEHHRRGLAQREPARRIDFRKGLAFPAARRPLDLEPVADDSVGIEIGCERERLDIFAPA